MPSEEVLDSLELLLSRIRERLATLENEEERIRRRLQELPIPNGSLDFRWVKNSRGRKYWYWYIVYYKDGRRYHKYLGKVLKPEHMGGSIEELRLAKHYASRLRRIESAKAEVEALLRRAEEALERAEVLIEGVAAPSPASDRIEEAPLAEGVMMG